MQGSAVSVVGISNWKLSDTASRQPQGERTASHGEKAHCSLGLWCYHPYCFATVFCQSYDDFSGEIEAFWVHPDSLHILPLPDYRPGRYRVLHCQLLDTGAQESSSLYMRFLIHFFPSFMGWLMMTSSIFLRSFQGQDCSTQATSTSCFLPLKCFFLGWLSFHMIILAPPLSYTSSPLPLPTKCSE